MKWIDQGMIFDNDDFSFKNKMRKQFSRKGKKKKAREQYFKIVFYPLAI